MKIAAKIKTMSPASGRFRFFRRGSSSSTTVVVTRTRFVITYAAFLFLSLLSSFNSHVMPIPLATPNSQPMNNIMTSAWSSLVIAEGF